MEVRHDEGVAIRIDPEPCADARKGGSEASVGERTGQQLSLAKIHILGADAVSGAPVRRACSDPFAGRRLTSDCLWSKNWMTLVGSSSKIVKANRPVIGQMLGMLRWWDKSVVLCAATLLAYRASHCAFALLIRAKPSGMPSC